MTMRRFGYCVSDLAPLKNAQYNESALLVYQIKLFLDQASYENEQLANVTNLMDSICRKGDSGDYPISVHIDVDKYANDAGKYYRCRAIDEALEPMYYAFRQAALNRSAPLDFSAITYTPNVNNKTVSYNLTDLINTSWIRAEADLEQVCKITDSVKEYVQAKVSRSKPDSRASTSSSSALNSFIEFMDRLLDPILGFTRRSLWEGNNMMARLSSSVGSGFKAIGSGISGAQKSVANMFGTRSQPLNSTSTPAATTTASPNTNANQAKPRPLV